MKTIHKNIKGFRGICHLLLITLLSALSIFSCKKFVEIPPPRTQIVTTTVFNNNAAATSAQLAIYSQMWNNAESWSMAQSMGTYGDELQSYSTQLNWDQLYTNSLQAITGPGPWVDYYQYIYDANSVISGLQTTIGASAAVKQQLTGEALFVRAFCHIYLTNIYGDVPLVLTTNYAVNGIITRTPRLQVMQQVITDLQNAKSMLNNNYVDGSDTTITTERVRPTKAGATALLARAYLYLGDYSKNSSYYAKADSAASAVIANSQYSLSPLSGVFLKNSSEAIWQLQTVSTAGVDTYDGDFFILTGAPSTVNGESTTISSQLQNSFEPGDQRFADWIGSITEGTNIYYFPYKYKVGNALENQEYTMVLRLGEQYLIRAEARVHEGNLTGATSDLNIIRNRAGLSNTTAASATDLATAILHERQVELFTEWGARWFDLVRTGNANNVMSVVCPLKGGTWSSSGYQLLFPIPQADRTADPNLTQNLGY
jgi:hypothetical protein